MFRTLYYYLFIIPAMIAIGCEPEYPAPVNPHASKEARELLSYIYGLRGKTILSGQHNYPSELMRSNDTIFVRTGKTPVIWGSDFGDHRNRAQMIQHAIEMHRKGHIITLMWHSGCPVDTIPSGIAPLRYKVSAEEWKAIVTPGTSFYDHLLADMDSVAYWLKVLEKERIPVLWRPYHEMNGIWFWWGNQPGKNGFEALWKIMYDRFTHYHKLNNLLWVWNTNAPRDWQNDTAYAYYLYYPGPQYVDILAADVYKKDYKQSHHDELDALANGKPVALGEIGEAPDPRVLDEQPMWTWFMMWAQWPWLYNTQDELKKLYTHPRVISMEHINR